MQIAAAVAAVVLWSELESFHAERANPITRFEIIVDHVARIGVWKSRAHYGIMHEDLAIPAGLRDRIDEWIDRYIELHDRLQDDPNTYAGWLDYDEEGQETARQIKPALDPDAEVYYFRWASEEYERVP